jgi:hypothetical protein
MFKKWLLILLVLIFTFISFTNLVTAELWDKTIMNSLIDTTDSNVIWGTIQKEWDWLSMLASIIVWVKDSLTGLLLLIAVAVFLFIWIRLALARWNPEEFKKGMMHFVYAVIWIFVVSLAWAAVTLVAWLTI